MLLAFETGLRASQDRVVSQICSAVLFDAEQSWCRETNSSAQGGFDEILKVFPTHFVGQTSVFLQWQNFDFRRRAMAEARHTLYFQIKKMSALTSLTEPNTGDARLGVHQQGPGQVLT